MLFEQWKIPITDDLPADKTNSLFEQCQESGMVTRETIAASSMLGTGQGTNYSSVETKVETLWKLRTVLG